jgi:RHS repeat-associated protein
MAPYGASSYRSARSGVDVSPRRYRYTGKERDEETGLDYFGARFYAPWLGRWTTADPLGLQAGLNLYLYGRASPVVFNDPSGMAAVSSLPGTGERKLPRGPAPPPARPSSPDVETPPAAAAPEPSPEPPPEEPLPQEVQDALKEAGSSFRIDPSKTADPYSVEEHALKGYLKGVWGFDPYTIKQDIIRDLARERSAADVVTEGLSSAHSRLLSLHPLVGIGKRVKGNVENLMTLADEAKSTGLRVEAGLEFLGKAVKDASSAVGGVQPKAPRSSLGGPLIPPGGPPPSLPPKPPIGGAGGGGRGTSRPLTAADLGLPEGTVVDGTFALRDGKATATIKYLGAPPEGLGLGLARARGALSKLAQGEGATTLRIETSRIIEPSGRLAPLLQRFGFQMRTNGTMWMELRL